MRIKLSARAQSELEWFEQHEPKVVQKIEQLLSNACETPFAGLGKPEALKYEFSGYWSRRINDEHRLVYKVIEDCLYVAQCRYHYGT